MMFTFDECALMSELEKKPTLLNLSLKLGKDVSVISRDLKRISQKAPVIEKINGRWVLTQKGIHLSSWVKKVAIEQAEILERDYVLTIATTREFAARILSLNFSTFHSANIRFKIMTCEGGIEEALLKGIADLGFDCGKPQDPNVAFKQVIEEKIVTVISPALQKNKKIKSVDKLEERDFVHYTRLSPPMNLDISKIKLASNDIAVVRGLLVNGKGWATLPYYAVKNEIKSKDLIMLPDGEIKGYKFGVWWLRGRDSLLPWIKHAESWLEKQDLSY